MNISSGAESDSPRRSEGRIGRSLSSQAKPIIFAGTFVSGMYSFAAEWLYACALKLIGSGVPQIERSFRCLTIFSRSSRYSVRVYCLLKMQYSFCDKPTQPKRFALSRQNAL